jgi:uncharacterized protein (TIGR03437 family)
MLRVIIPVLAVMGLAFGWTKLNQQNSSEAQSPALSPAAVNAQPELPEAEPQIRTSEVRFDFTSSTVQPESQQDMRLTPQGYSISQGSQSASLISMPVAVTLDAPVPFLALSAFWSKDSADDAKLTVSVRGSINGNDWRDWQLSSLDGDPRAQSGLFFLPADTRFIQYRLELGRDPRNASPIISEMRFRFISPGITSRRLRERMQSLPRFEGQRTGHRLNAGGGLFPRPAVISRTDWGCPDGQQQHRGAPSYTTVTHLIVHHTATGNDATDWPAIVRSIWNFHVFTNGWSDLGYNYLIDPSGQIYEGRAGGDNVLGAHFSCANSGTMGISMLGNFTSVTPASQAQTSLKYLLAWKSDQRGLDPLGANYHNGTKLNLKQISGHRDSDGAPPPACPGTECPGNSFYPLLPAIRTDVKSFTDPAEDFSLASIEPQTISAGSSKSFTLSTTTIKGGSQVIRLSLSGLPKGVSATINPETITSGNSATLTISSEASAAGGVYPVSLIGTGSTIRAQQINLTITGTLTTVSAANYRESVAREAIVAAFGAGLASKTESASTLPLPATLSGVNVKLRDSQNIERTAPLFFVSPLQINFLIPKEVASGTAAITVESNGNAIAAGTVTISEVAPAIFTADASGTGAPAALILRVRPDGTQIYEPVAEYDTALQRFALRPIDVSVQSGQAYLILYGTGIRYRSAQENVRVQVAEAEAQVVFANAQGDLVGLDQVNALLPASLAGKNETDVVLTVDGRPSNIVRLSVR